MIPKRGEKGFTLIEVLVGLGIATILTTTMSGILYTYFRVFETNTQTRQAVRSLVNAETWISRDLQLANTCDLIEGGGPTNTMTVSWTAGTDVHTVTYSLINGDLQRDHNGQINIPARDISSIAFSRLDGAVTTTIVASPDSRWGTTEQHTIVTYMQAGD
jgi:prepilin-type N-terminal cleavage/methylation domain-containing protein